MPIRQLEACQKIPLYLPRVCETAFLCITDKMKKIFSAFMVNSYIFYKILSGILYLIALPTWRRILTHLQQTTLEILIKQHSNKSVLKLKPINCLCIINPFPHIDIFRLICSRWLLKTLWQKVKLLIMCNFIFCHNIFQL